MPLPLFIRACFVWCLSVLLGISFAQPSSQPAPAPTLIDSKDFFYDDLKQLSIFSGNVVLTRGNLLLKADRLEMQQDAQGFQSGKATGSGQTRVYFRHTLENSTDYFEGYANTVTYDGKSEIITLSHQAEVTKFVCAQARDSIKGDTILVDQRTESYRAIGGAQSPTTNQKVRSIFQPKGNENNPCQTLMSPSAR